MIRFVCLCIVAAASTLTATAGPGINTVLRGSCPGGREWYSSLEFDEKNTFLCANGIYCDGTPYTTCGEVARPASTARQKSSVMKADNSYRVVMDGGAATVSLHDVQTGQLLRDLGTVHDSAVIPYDNIPSGMFIVVARDPITGQVTDSHLILKN